MKQINYTSLEGHLAVVFTLVDDSSFRNIQINAGINSVSDDDYAFLSAHPDFQRMLQSGEIILMDLPEETPPETPPETPIKEAKPLASKPTKDNA